jgi:hypothetical protein
MQEGSDNIDINADTIDGKNTFHSLARVEAPRRTHEFDKSIVTSIESLVICNPIK